MTDSFKAIDVNKLLFVNVITSRQHRETDTSADWYKDWTKKVIDKAREKNTSICQLYLEEAKNYTLHSRIIGISLGFINGTDFRTNTLVGEEKEILKQFVDIAKKANKVLVFWNSGFELSTIRKRFVLNGLSGFLSAKQGNDSMQKPWTLNNVLNLSDVWNGLGYSFDDLATISKAFNLEPYHYQMSAEDGFLEGNLDIVKSEGQTNIHNLKSLFDIFKNV